MKKREHREMLVMVSRLPITMIVRHCAVSAYFVVLDVMDVESLR